MLQQSYTDVYIYIYIYIYVCVCVCVFSVRVQCQYIVTLRILVNIRSDIVTGYRRPCHLLH